MRFGLVLPPQFRVFGGSFHSLHAERLSAPGLGPMSREVAA